MAGTSLPGYVAHSTTHDGVCISCRTRKIRCGREKPQCGCCRRDQVECVYSSPPKRVNHVKVLSQSIDEIQDRLIMMQEELSWLTAALKRSNIAGRLELDFERGVPSIDGPPPFHGDDTAAAPATAGHVVRDGGTQIERYYGPWTLVGLCRDFEAGLASQVGNNNDEVVGGLVNKMLLDPTGTDDGNLDLGASPGQLDASMCLPPRQLLSVMLESFLKQADYRTDIFCRQTIYEAVERVYMEPSSPTSEPWALCFNLIILLTLGAEHPVHGEDPFVRPMLQAAHATARKQSCFMSPRLVNVQALALFSLLAQQSHTDNKTLGDSFFAQACILARELGLHQAGHRLAPTSNLSAAEAEERQKVFGSLYIRDRYSVTACGALTWLPGAGPKGPPPPNGIPSNQPCPQHTAHWELAKVQDELHRLISSADAPATPVSERRTALARLQQKLETWTQTHKVPSSNRPTTVDEISLHLAFLGTRIRVLDSDNNAAVAARSVSAQAIYDARLSCLLVATSCSDHLNQALVDRLDRLLKETEPTFYRAAGANSSSATSLRTSASSPSLATSSSATDAPQRPSPQTPPLSSSSLGPAPFSAPLPFHRLANVFPIAAVFVLARQILAIDACAQSSQSQNDEQRQQEINQDILLLEALLLCFRSTARSAAEAARGKVNSDAHDSRLGRVIQHLVEIIRAIVGPTGRGGGADDANGDGNDDYAYAVSEPPLASTSSLLLDAFSNAISKPNLSLYSSGDLFPSHLGPPQTSSSSSSRSACAAPQDSMSSAATPLWTPQSSSLYAPFITPMASIVPDTPFDISQFLDHMGDASSPVIWDDGQGQAEFHMQQQQQPQQQQPQCVPETTRKRSRKRPRTDGEGSRMSTVGIDRHRA